MARLWLYDIAGSATAPRSVRRASTVDRRNARSPRSEGRGLRVLATILLIVGSVGYGGTADLVTGPWQGLLFATFLVAGVAGLVLTWTLRP
jgi:hypothetical protein